MAEQDIFTKLKRVERDIKMERLVRRNIVARREDTADIDKTISNLCRRAAALRKQMDETR